MAEIKIGIARKPKIFIEEGLSFKDIEKDFIVNGLITQDSDEYHIKTKDGRQFVLVGELKEVIWSDEGKGKKIIKD